MQARNYYVLHVCCLCACRFFRRRINILFEFIPQVVFLTSIFGYLILLIFYKWMAYSEKNSSEAPSLLIRTFYMSLPPPPLPAPVLR